MIDERLPALPTVCSRTTQGQEATFRLSLVIHDYDDDTRAFGDEITEALGALGVKVEAIAFHEDVTCVFVDAISSAATAMASSRWEDVQLTDERIHRQLLPGRDGRQDGRTK